MIFETSDFSFSWDGKDAPAGSYVWVIHWSDRLGKSSKMSGGVTLLK